MNLAGKVVVITGAAGGIGSAMARRFAAEKPEALVLADLDGDRAAGLCEELRAGGTETTAAAVDVTVPAQIAELVDETLNQFGRVDLFCANAGIVTGQGLDADDETWARVWQVNVQAHVSSAKAVLPSMLERGDGYLLHTASAAGLLTSIGDAPYAVTKHAAVAFAEWLAITYGDRGIKVSALCPQGVDTPMLRGGIDASHLGAKVIEASGEVISAEQVAEDVVAALAAEQFLILPHPEVAKYYRNRATDTDRWLGGMRKLVSHLDA